MEDVEAYLDSSVNTKFENLKFTWNVACSLCYVEFQTFQEQLEHISRHHNEDIDEYPCVMQECAYFATTKELLARHVVRKHSLLESLQIYSRCACCKQGYSNFNDLNRHTCCRSIKWEPGQIWYCVECKREFSSHKRYIFHVQFHSDKVRPRVCLICDSEFTDTDEFFEHVHYEHQTLGDMPCKRCDRNFKDKQLYEAHLRSHSKPFKYECIFCQKRYNYKALLNSHQEIYHSSELVQWHCDLCDKVYSKESSLKTHMKVHSFDTKIRIYYCVECGLIGHEEQAVMRHMEDVDDSPCFLSEIDQDIISAAYTCEYCCADFKSMAQLQTHRRSKLHADGMYKCNLCDFTFNQYRKLRAHIKNHPTYQKLSKAFPVPRLYLCDHENCLEAYPLWSLLYSHKRSHKPNKRHTPADLKCSFCDRQFQSKMALAVHISRSHNNSNLQCGHCKRLFQDEPTLERHIQTNHEPVVCQYCNKTIKNRRNLQLHHRVVHSAEHNFHCQHCHKGFFYESEKNNHEANIHANVTYECTTCKFQTKYFKSLQIHLDSLHREQRHECGLCRKTFARLQSLLRHNKGHEAKNEFQCPNRLANGCSLVFSSSALLQEHVLNDHQDEEPPLKRFKPQHTQGESTNDEPKYIKGLDYIELYDENRELTKNAEQSDCELYDDNTDDLIDEDLVSCDEYEREQQDITVETAENECLVDYSGSIEELLDYEVNENLEWCND